MTPPRTILEALGDAFVNHADRIAIEEWPSGRTLTYEQLDLASAALAAELRAQGVAPGTFVPIVMPRSANFLVAVVAVLRCGAAYAPIDPADPRRKVLLEPLCSSVVVGTEPDMLDPSSVNSIGPPPAIDVDSEAPAYVMYTSGTTGTPKGVVVPHRAVVRLVIGANFASFGPQHRWAVMSAVAFDASTLEVWGALLHGGCAVVQCEAMPSLDQLSEYFRRGRIGHAWLTAALFNTMVDEFPQALRGLDQLLTGGERESVPHVRRCLERCTGTRLIHGYGPTENTTFSLCHTISREDATGERIPIGTPISGSTARIVEPGGSPDATLEEGELLVGGLGLALGYLHDDARTRDKFVLDTEGTRWYRTGDLVRRREDGAIVFLGRVDRQVKIRGHRIEPDGIERELAACVGVEQAAVVVSGDSAETRQLIAFVVLAKNAVLDEVRAALASRVPRAMLPDRIIGFDTMPIGRTGKVDREALLRRVVPSPEHTAAASDTERRLADLFKTRLGRPIGPSERFQDAGGHSLMAMRLSADVRREFGVSLPAAEILRQQTIAGLALLINLLPKSDNISSDATATDPVGDIRRRASLEHARDDTGRAMLVHRAWHVRPALPIAQLREAWLTILERHDALRTRVSFTEDGPALLELTPADEAVFHAEQDRLRAPDPRHPSVVHACQRTIEPGEPPARLHAWPIDDGSQLLLMVFHHAAIDEWSLELLENELDTILRGEHLGEPVPYGMFVRRERAGARPELAVDIANRISAGGAETNPLPPPGPQPGRVVVLDPSLLSTEQLETRAQALDVSPAALALSTLAAILRARFGPPGQWIMTPVAKRETEALQRVVGCCLDMRPIEAAGDELPQIASHVHAQLLDAQGNATLPLEALIERVRSTAPSRADDATRFGMTYRIMDDRPRALGSSEATPVDIDLDAARFGLCLHVERRTSGLRVWIEASRDHFSQSQLEAIGVQFAAGVRGEGLDKIESRHSEPVACQSPDSSGVSHTELNEMGDLWRELLGRSPEPSSDFFSCGGTSLMAMRLAAAVHRRLGRRLMLNQFLRAPTFAELVRSIRDDVEQPFAEFSTRTRSDTNDSWCVAIPGSAGRAIDLHRLWKLLGASGRIPMDTLAFDLATIATGEETTFDQRRFFARFTALTHAHAMSNDRRGPITLLGYSLGGLVVMDMVGKLIELGHTIERVVLLDAYSPAYLSRTPAWYLAKVNARIRRLGHSVDRPQDVERSPDQDEAHAAEASRSTWQAIHGTLARWKPPAIDVPVVLVRSAPAWNHVRPLRHAETNGLGPLLRGSVDIRVLDIEHLALLTDGAEEVARATADVLTQPTSPTPPVHDAPRLPSAHRSALS